MSSQAVPPDPVETPVETPFADAASPFKRTEAPVFPGPPQLPLIVPVQSTWNTYRSQINFGLAMLAYLMVLVGSILVIQDKPAAGWRYFVAALPAVPAVVGLVIFMRLLARLDPAQIRIQLQALGLSVGGTALATFGYGFLEGAGLPHLSPAYVLPLMAVFWGAGTAFFTWRSR